MWVRIGCTGALTLALRVDLEISGVQSPKSATHLLQDPPILLAPPTPTQRCPGVQTGLRAAFLSCQHRATTQECLSSGVGDRGSDTSYRGIYRGIQTTRAPLRLGMSPRSRMREAGRDRDTLIPFLEGQTQDKPTWK